MEIILLTDIAGVGYKNDIVTVKAGYGRNYLIPQGFALLANESNRKIVAENVRQAAHKAEKPLVPAGLVYNGVAGHAGGPAAGAICTLPKTGAYAVCAGAGALFFRTPPAPVQRFV